MKKLLLVTTMFLSMSASAITEKQMTECKGIGRLSTMIMELRQDSEPMNSVLEVFESDDYGRRVYVPIVIEAYGVSSFSSAEMKARKAAEFGNDKMVECITNYGE